MAATRSDEGQRQCCLDNVSDDGPPVRSKKSGGLVKNRHRWSAGGRALPVTRQAALLKRCQTKTLRPTGAPLPHLREKGRRRRCPSAETNTRGR